MKWSVGHVGKTPERTMTSRPPSSQRPPAAGGPERPAFKLGGLLGTLIEAGYDEDAREVVELYLDDHGVTFSKISTALDRGELEQCGDAAHTLIGSAGGIGAMELAEALSSLEAACRIGDITAVEAIIPTIEAERERVHFTAREFLDRGPTQG